MVGINTGLREGDICKLRWSEINLQTGWITRTMNKTGKAVKIPILKALGDYLSSLDQNGDFCFPDLKKRYDSNPTTIGKYVTEFLDSLGIENQKRIEGRRAVSTKDIHSCRHTFCYLAAVNGIPFPIVQSVVGHMSPEMTKRYLDHANESEIKKAFNAIPDYMGTAVAIPENTRTREEIEQLKKNIIKALATADDGTVIKMAELI